jgi:cytosine/adenosine deaminase-related metal-dependent hydrolase
MTWRSAITLLTVACGTGSDSLSMLAPEERLGIGTAVAFVDVYVLPMDAERVVSHQTVLIRDGFITAVGPVGSISVPEGATVIEGRGAFYLMPGLADFHTHAHQLEDLVGYAANGVTSILQMGQPPDVPAMERRAEVNAGEIFGPHIYAGWFINGPGGGGNVVLTDQAAREAVRYAKANGYEFVKVYNFLTASQFSAIVAEARSQGIAVIGHGVRSVGMEGLLRGGQVMVAHAEEYIYTWFGDTTNPALLPGAVALTRETGAYLTGNPSAYEAIDKQWGKPAQVQAYLNQPEARYLHPEAKERWRKADYAQRAGGLGDRTAFVRTLIKAMLDGGVPILLGTDSPFIPGMFPGFSIHDEIRNLILAGFTPYQALSSGTRVAGEFIAHTVPGAEPFGQVSVGQRADLLLLPSNPLARLTVLKTPTGVMIRGRWWNAAALKARLEQIVQ